MVAVLLAGTGWLYLLQRAGLLAVGPRVAGALPLQQLADGAAQPLARLALAWVPAGLVAGLALRAGRDRLSVGRLVALTVVCELLLMAVGAASDAASISGPPGEHLRPQLTRAGTHVAVGLILAGALMVRRRGRPGSRRAATGR